MSRRLQETQEFYFVTFHDFVSGVGCFSEDESSFFPVNHYPTFIKGRDEIRSRFEAVIAKIQGAGLTRIDLPVQDLEIAEYGDTALATFQIFDNDISRRTLLLHKTDNEWRIVHLHASNAPLGNPK